MALEPSLPLRNRNGNANSFHAFPGTNNCTTIRRESRPISTENRLRALYQISLIAVAAL